MSSLGGCFYPDAYEFGQPNQGIAILYELLNEQPACSPMGDLRFWPDLEQAMGGLAASRIPAWTRTVRVSPRCPGASFSTELGYSNLRPPLDAGGHPDHLRRPDDRAPREEPCRCSTGATRAFKPRPLADFLDAVFSGTARSRVSPSPLSSASGSSGVCPARDGLLLSLSPLYAAAWYRPRCLLVTYPRRTRPQCGQFSPTFVPASPRRFASTRCSIPRRLAVSPEKKTKKKKKNRTGKKERKKEKQK